MTTFTETITLERVECGSCGGVFALISKFIEHARNNCGGYKCPYCGIGWSWSESEADRLRKQLVAKQGEILKAQQDVALARQRALAADEQRYKNERKLKRAEKGVCPCCTRSFTNLRRHMATVHGVKNGEKPKP